MFDTLPEDKRNDELSLLHESNQVNMVAVKTAVGLTERVNMPSIVQQGGTWGSMLCSNTVDTLGKKCRDRGEHIYLYKKVARVLPLAFVDDLNGIARCGLESIALNTFITTQIELKKLKFHVPDEKGKTKCHKIHIGKNHSMCPTLTVHGTKMPEVTEDTYLGDIISNDGKNTKNVKHRVSKGLGILNQIFNILDNISFGSKLFEIAILLRDSMLINGMLTNVEIWYNLTKSEIDEFENLDKLFFRKLLEVPVSTPSEAFYLELGVLPVAAIIKARRVNYLHNILMRDKTSMLYTFFITQWQNPTRGDWTNQVKEDLEDLGIPCSFTFIQSKSKEAFKKLVKTKTKEFALKILKKRQETHTKMKNVVYTDLKVQSYFSSEEFNSFQKKTIFKFRTRMERFGENFRGGAEKVTCPLCNLHLDNQEMSMQCPEVKKVMKIEGNMEDIYKETIKKEIVETITNITKIRREKEV